MSDPWKPAKYTKADVLAFKALADGTANAAQQQRAVSWLFKCTGVDDWPYHPTPRDTDIALGKQWVGHQILKLTNLTSAALEAMKDG